MIRTLLMLLALAVLVVAVLVWLGAISLQQSESGQINATVSPLEVKMETRNVQVQVPTIQPSGPTDQPPPANQAQPAR